MKKALLIIGIKLINGVRKLNQSQAEKERQKKSEKLQKLYATA